MLKIKERNNEKTVGARLRPCTEKGITLIALVITIVLMLILAGITINVTINGGLFNYAKKAKDSTEITSEKETLQKASIIAEGNSKTGRITVEEMQKALDQVINEGTATAINNGETIVVKFNESNRYYEVDNKGNVEKIDVIIDENPGNIKVGMNGETLNGEENPFEIWCIEDLIELSKNYTNYKNSNIKLCQTLDFKSELSYANSKRTDYGDLNKDGKTETLIQEMQTGIGFMPIKEFSGTFDGNLEGHLNEIKNIYISSANNSVGLFETVNNEGTIKNLKVSGDIVQTAAYNSNVTCGGIVGKSDVNTTIENCVNNANITGPANTGGIAGWSNGKIFCCYNLKNITGYSAGGIIGTGNATIINCYNTGTITSPTNSSAGINGAWTWASKSKIYNCYNKGTIISNGTNIYSVSGGMFGYMYNGIESLDIINCYNTGELKAYFMKGSMIAIVRAITPNTRNCYYLNQNYKDEYSLTTSCTEDYMKSQEFVDELNSNIENGCPYEQENEEGVVETVPIDTTGWAKWVYNENSYPTLDFNTIWNGTTWEKI